MLLAVTVVSYPVDVLRVARLVSELFHMMDFAASVLYWDDEFQACIKQVFPAPIGYGLEDVHAVTPPPLGTATSPSLHLNILEGSTTLTSNVVAKYVLWSISLTLTVVVPNHGQPLSDYHQFECHSKKGNHS